MSKPENPPAFPCPSTMGPQGGTVIDCKDFGMTLRDYFAAAALTGIISAQMEGRWSDKPADLAFEFADAMLEARTKEDCRRVRVLRGQPRGD